MPNEEIDHMKINQHKLPALKIHIMQQWDDQTRINYDSKRTTNIFGAWKKILDLCINGLPLTGQHINQTSNDHIMSRRQSVNGTRMK